MTNDIVFLSMKSDFVLSNSAGPDEIPRSNALYLVP